MCWCCKYTDFILYTQNIHVYKYDNPYKLEVTHLPKKVCHFCFRLFLMVYPYGSAVLLCNSRNVLIISKLR